MRRPNTDHALPLAYLALAALLVAVIVPTALRPPVEPPTSSAELDPNAPPDDQESIVSAFGRPTSRTAGAATDGPGDVVGEGPGAAVEPRFCPQGFGSPPRQVESLYAAPCSGAFTGDNGGATARRGVTASEIRVAVVYRGGDTGMTEGPVSDTPTTAESAQNRSLRVYQRYFNQNYQTYGRTLRLFALGISTNPNNQRAGAQAVDEEFKAFGSIGVGGASVPYMEEAARRRILAFGGVHFSQRWISQFAPYVFDWETDGTAMLELTSEYICKKLAGKTARFSSDSNMQRTPRKFGLLFYNEAPIYDTFGDEMNAFLRDECGIGLTEAVAYGLREDQDQIATAVARFRAAGVTTVAIFSDAATPIAVANAATQQGWFPEWLLTGATQTVDNLYGRRYDPSQWRSAFGLSFYELPRLPDETDAWRAYRIVDPYNEPHEDTAVAFYSLLQFMNGVQLAGPNLSAESIARALIDAPRRPPEPVWSVGGGFGPGDYTYGDYAAELWWDPGATDPITGEPGAYRYTRGGARFTHGEVPREDPLVFRDGVTRADG